MRVASQWLAEGVRGNGVRARRQDALLARGQGDATIGADRVGAEGMHGQGWTRQSRGNTTPDMHEVDHQLSGEP